MPPAELPAHPRPPAAPFRRPEPPTPIERIEVPHPALPAALDGLTALHLSDLHLRRHARHRIGLERLEAALRATEADLVLLTGDIVDRPGQEHAGAEVLARLAGAWRPRLGAFGIFGNHDTVAFRAMARQMPGIRWLDASCVPVDGAPGLSLLGMPWPEDLLAAAVDGGVQEPDGDRFTLTLVHAPTTMIAAADLGLPLLLAGHTHAGQVRVSARLAPHTSSDIPAHLASGMLRLRSTLCCVSRGLGEALMTGLRLNCPRQAPLYTLRRGPLPPIPPGGSAGVVTQVVPW